VVKPLAEPIVWEGSGESVVFTRRVTAKDLDTLDGVDTTAHLFQAFQEKRCEYRVMAVGADQLFAVAIHAAAAFQALGRPDRTRFGVTALDDPDSQYVWLDDPNGAHSFLLPAPRQGPEL
jgi:hypothetical protein